MEMQKILNFLENLEQNNNKKWMDEYRVYYEEARYIFKDTIQEYKEKESEMVSDHKYYRRRLSKADSDLRTTQDVIEGLKTDIMIYMERLLKFCSFLN